MKASATATYDDLCALPDNFVGEILAGRLVARPRPAPRHLLATTTLGSLLVSKFHIGSPDERGDWWILDKPECHLGPDIVVPDIAGWRRSTMQDFPDVAWFETTPDWVCEIGTPSTPQRDRSIKRDIYARQGVCHYWIVDPAVQAIEAFALDGDRWVPLAAVHREMTVALPPFEEMQLELSDLWA